MATLVAVMREPCNTYSSGEEHEKVNYRKALIQHRKLQAVYKRHGYKVELLPRSRKWSASVFTQDNALVIGDQAIILNGLSWWRTKEPRHGSQLQRVLSKYLSVVDHLGLPALLDGGEVVQTDTEILVGIACKAAKRAVKQIRAKLDLDRPIRTVSTPNFEYVHLGSEMSYLGGGILLVTKQFSRVAPARRYETYIVHKGEEDAANCVLLHDGAVLAPADCPNTVRWLEAIGFDVEVVNISEFHKGDGHMSCLSINIEL